MESQTESWFMHLLTLYKVTNAFSLSEKTLLRYKKLSIQETLLSEIYKILKYKTA